MTSAELEPLSVAVPLYEDPPGVFRVGKSWVLLELVIRAYLRGQTPESIVESYDSLNLSDVYAVLGYYLSRPQLIDEYLRRCDALALETRRLLESSQTTIRGLRERIISRARSKGLIQDEASG